MLHCRNCSGNLRNAARQDFRTDLNVYVGGAGPEARTKYVENMLRMHISVYLKSPRRRHDKKSMTAMFRNIF